MMSSLSSLPTPYQCKVCQAPAGEHLHYGATCCFSCRAFFRRYADREGKCVCTRGDGLCVVNMERRNDCMHCRLKKCLKVGMKKDFVRGPNQALRKRRQEQGFKGRKAIGKPQISSVKTLRSRDKDNRLERKPIFCRDVMLHSVRPSQPYHDPLFQRTSSSSPDSPISSNDTVESSRSSDSSKISLECKEHYYHRSKPEGYDLYDRFDTPSTSTSTSTSRSSPLETACESDESSHPKETLLTTVMLPTIWSVGLVQKDDDSETEDEKDPGLEVKREYETALCAKTDGPTITFTNEEFALVDFIKRTRNFIVSKIGNAYYDPSYRKELTTILVSKGKVKPSFNFLEKLNKSLLESSTEVMSTVLDLFDVSDQAKKLLLADNLTYSCLVGTAAYTYGNKAPTFVEQAKLSGMTSLFVQYLEDNGLAEVVPRMEAHYLNPSPWAEKESFEVEFDQILRQIGYHVGTDQFLTCLLIMAHIFNLSNDTERLLSPREASHIRKTKSQIVLLLNRYLRTKFGPKKASSKTHHHFYLMNSLMTVSKIYMERKLKLTQADNYADINI